MAWTIEALRPYNQRPARHHAFLLSELEAVAYGHCDRLALFLPPNSAKTTYASILFPAWFMAQASNQHLIGASHGGRYAEDLSGQVIRMATVNAELLGYKPSTFANDLWRTTNNCIYRAAGAGGSITGRRADLFIIDDPIKGRQDADSPTIRETVWNWYRAEVLTRLNPGARIILIQTRWHEDDLAGRLLGEMEAGTGDSWRVVNLPAIAEDNDMLGREPGEALWPERFPVEALARTRAGVGEREWAALYQQRPRAGDGVLFKIEKFGTVLAAPAGGRIVRAWDLAATEQTGGRNPDWTVGLKLMRDADGRFYVLDVVRFRGSPNEVETAIVNTARQDGAAVRIGLPQDPGQAGKQQVLYLTSKLAGYRVSSSPETGSKETRAMPVASQVEVGNVALVRAAWNRPLLEELASFPAGTHDDQTDALSRAFGMLVQLHAPVLFSDAGLAQMARPGQAIV